MHTLFVNKKRNKNYNSNLPTGYYCSCGIKASYNEKYDAYYCSTANIWLESSCVDFNCGFCNPKRPEKPL